MSVVNCKCKHIRPKYKNLAEWVKDDNNVYIGRKGIVFIDKKRFPEKSSPFANPFKVDRDGNREEILMKYKIYIDEKLQTNPDLMAELLTLKNKNLGCWCYPESCHGNILLELIETYSP